MSGSVVHLSQVFLSCFYSAFIRCIVLYFCTEGIVCFLHTLASLFCHISLCFDRLDRSFKSLRGVPRPPLQAVIGTVAL